MLVTCFDLSLYKKILPLCDGEWNPFSIRYSGGNYGRVEHLHYFADLFRLS